MDIVRYGAKVNHGPTYLIHHQEPSVTCNVEDGSINLHVPDVKSQYGKVSHDYKSSLFPLDLAAILKALGRDAAFITHIENSNGLGEEEKLMLRLCIATVKEFQRANENGTG